MTEIEKVIAEYFTAAAKDLESHKAAIARLAENQTAEHAKLVELAEVVNRHTAILESLRLAVEAKIGKQADERGHVN
jgi:hypothetical protein